MSGLIGRTLGHYRITAKIGEGGMGEVYRAHDERLGREVAIKVIHQKIVHDAERLARFEREANAVARLTHPNVLEIWDFGTEDGVTYAVTELLEGSNLRARIPSSGLPWQKVADIGAAIADGLAAAHGKGIVHRDLKPENVFVTSDGRVKVLDFGLARIREKVDLEAETGTLTPDGTATGTILGTVGYMAPEQVKGGAADHRSDIFALGCVLYEMVSGRRPFEGESTVEIMAAILKEEPQQLSSTGARLPGDLERVIHRCLEKSPDARFQSASDLAFGLRSMGAAQPVAMATPTGEIRPVTGRRRWWPAAVAVVALVGIGVVGWQIMRPPVTATEESRAPRAALPFTPIDEWLVVVEPFANRTGDPSLDFIGPSLVDSLEDGLGHISQGIHSLPSVVVLSEHGQLDSTAVQGQRPVNQSRIVVAGSYARAGRELEAVFQVRDPAVGRVLYTGDPIEVSARPTEGEKEAVTQAVMGAVGVHAYLRLENVSHVPTFGVFHEFLAGLELLWGKGDREGEKRIEGALRADPEFLRPAAYLAGQLLLNRKPDLARPYVEHIRQRAQRLTELENLELEVYEAWCEELMGRALDAARSLRQLVPWDLQAIVLQWKAAEALNRPGEIVQLTYVFDVIPPVYKRFRRMTMMQAARAYDRLGRYEDLLRLARQMREDTPGDSFIFATEGIALAGLGRLEELDDLVDACGSFPGGECDEVLVLNMTSWHLAANGNTAKSLEYGNRAVRLLESLPEDEFARQQSGYLDALQIAGRWDEYGAVARKLADGADDGSDDKKYFLACVGMAAGHAGDRETAESLISEFEASESFYYAALIAANLGDLDRAVAYLDRSLNHPQGITYSMLYRWDMDLQPLWGYPPFEEMVRPKG